jgi:hypothetical protein
MLKRAVLTALLTLGLMMNALGQARQTKAAPEAVGAKALAFFEHANGQSLDQYLKSIRPQQIPQDLKAYVMARIPKAIEVKPSASGRDKLDALKPVLTYHERGAAYEIKIGRIGKAYVGLYACAALLISEEGLELLTAEELQAVVAHEIGHDYFWHEYQLADRERQDGLAQELELRCDGIAIITMSQLGLDPARLMSAITKLTKFNARLGDHSRAYAYPSLDERLAFNRAMTKLVRARA